MSEFEGEQANCTLEHSLLQYLKVRRCGNHYAAAAFIREANAAFPPGFYGRITVGGAPQSPTIVGNLGLANLTEQDALVRVMLEPMRMSRTCDPGMHKGVFEFARVREASRSTLLEEFAASLGNVVQPGEYEHFKSVPRSPKRYRVFGVVVHGGVLHVLYTAMYPPYNGLLALRPLTGPGGFFTRVANGARPDGYPPHFGARFTLIRAMTPAQAAEGI